MVRFEPLRGKEGEFRDEVLRVSERSRAEPGCLRIDVFESLREPFIFAIHSEWVDEASFELARDFAAHCAVSRGCREATDASNPGAPATSDRWLCRRWSKVTPLFHCELPWKSSGMMAMLDGAYRRKVLRIG